MHYSAFNKLILTIVSLVSIVTVVRVALVRIVAVVRHNTLNADRIIIFVWKADKVGYYIDMIYYQ